MTSSDTLPARAPVWARFVAVLIALAAVVLVVDRSLDRDLNHDEHQFLAPAALFGREGLVPWKDFLIYHLPNLIYAYGAADWATGNLILGAKLLNVLATGCVIAGMVLLALRRHGIAALWTSATGVLLLLSDPLFRYTAGKTWNHEIPTALLLGGGGLLTLALRRDRLWLTAVAGLLGGLAAGCRLTFAPTLIGFVAFACIYPLPTKRRLHHILVLTTAATLALGPSLFSLVSETERFIFANFRFPRLRLIDESNTRIQKTVSLWRKVRFFFKEIVLPSWPLFLVWSATSAKTAWQWLRTRSVGNPVAAFWLLQLPFILAGCFAPTRYQLQHFYVLIPILAFGVATTRFSTEHPLLQRLAPKCSLCIALIAFAFSAKDYGAVTTLTERDKWFSTRFTQQAGEIADQHPNGPILTLAPAFPLSAGLQVYPEFAAGTFGWRSARLVPAEQRKRLQLVAPDDLDALLQQRPPGAILTGVEDDKEEAPLIAWAERNQFQKISLKKKRVLWLPSPRS